MPKFPKLFGAAQTLDSLRFAAQTDHLVSV